MGGRGRRVDVRMEGGWATDPSSGFVVWDRILTSLSSLGSFPIPHKTSGVD